MVWLFHSPVTIWEGGDLYLALGDYYLSLRRLEEGQTAPCGIFLAPVLVPDVEGDNEDNDDDGG